MNTLKTFYRNFKKQKLIYGITIGGFAISLAVLVLMVSFILEERSVDKHFPNIKNMYRVKQANGNAQIPKRMYEPILTQAPEIEKMCLINANGIFYEYNDEKKWANVVSTNKEFMDVFSVDIISGDREGLLDAKSDVVITETFAKKVFGEKNPLGEIIEFDNKEEKIVKAIIADPLKTSSLKYDVLMNLEQQMFHSTRGYNDESYIMYNMVFVLNPNAKPEETENKIANILQTYEGYEETLLQIQPFKEVYFDLKGDNDAYTHANLNMIRLLSWVALIILLMAIINYVNLSTAFNNERHKEICIRKTTGAKRSTIFSQFLKESYLSCLIALVLAIGIAILISPIFTDLFGREINVSEALKKSQIIIVLLILLLVVGGITGLFPALSVSRFNPIDLLQRKIKLKNSGLRGLYNTFQLFATICLIIGLIVIVKQINFVKTKDVGFNKELLLSVRLHGKTQSRSKVIKENLLKYPNILNVSGTHGKPFAIYGTSSGSWDIDSVEYRIEDVANVNTDTAFLSTFDLELIKGRNFRPTDIEACIINEKTYDYLQMDDIEGMTMWGSKIIGVVKDFHFKKMYDELGFIRLQYHPDQISHLNIKITGNNIPETIGIIKNALKEFEPGMVFDPVFYDDWINTMYQQEERQAKAIKIYVVLAVLLSCLGLLGLAEFAAIRRTKEIGIRKVNGAKISEILTMLNKGFVKWVVIAFVIATPIAYLAMNKWLESFAYKTTLSWWIFALAGLLALGIALLTVSWQSLKAATRNPVEALRYE